MLNGRYLFLLIMTILVVAVVLILRDYQNLYKALPINIPEKVTAGQFDDWRIYRSDSGRFTVMMPGLTQNAAESIIDPKTHEKRRYNMYVAQRANGNIFMITMITFPSSEDLSNPEQMYDSVVAEMLAANSKNELENKEIKVVNNQKVLDFTIKGDTVTSKNRAMISGNNLFLLSYMAKPGLYDLQEFNYFVDSFTLSSGVKQIVPEKA